VTPRPPSPPHRCPWTGAVELRQSCPACSATLRLTYPSPRAPWDDGATGVWRYRSWLPIDAATTPVTLGEGGTPLIDAEPLDPAVRVLIKDESRNPTLSFKDRPVAVATTVARERGAEGLLCASTGNTAVAVAAYAARAGLPAVCLVPARTPLAKLRMATGAGASVLRVEGEYSAAHALAGGLARRLGWANLTSTYLNPFMLEGDKTVALELFDQLGGRLPDAIVVPVGAGPLLAGIAQGIEELRADGRVDGTRVRLHAVQAAGCAPIARAYAAGRPVEPWPDAPATRAGSIADALAGYPEDGQRTLDCVVDSGGAVLAAHDEALEAAASDLRLRLGLSAELGAAAAAAGLRQLRADGRVHDGETVVLVVTGHGAKDDPAADATDAVVGTVAAGDLDAAEAALKVVAHA
jgi:threonine synthase